MMFRLITFITPIALWLVCRVDVSAQTARYALPAAYLVASNSVASPGSVFAPKLEREQNLEITDWATGFTATEQQGEFVLQFNPGIRAGSLMVYGGESFECLTQSGWKKMDGSRDVRRLLQVLPFPANENVEALRIRVRPEKKKNTQNGLMEYQSTLRYVAVIPVRAINISSSAKVTASHCVGTEKPETLVDGMVDEKKNFFTGKPQNAGTEYIQLVWDKPVTFRGLCVFRGSEDAGFGFANVFINTTTNGPVIHGDKWTDGWRRMDISQVAESNFRSLVFMIFDGYVTTRSLSFRSRQEAGIGLGEILILQTIPK